MARKRKIIEINLGRRCAFCRKRYLNPFAHVCKIRASGVRARNHARKNWR